MEISKTESNRKRLRKMVREKPENWGKHKYEGGIRKIINHPIFNFQHPSPGKSHYIAGYLHKPRKLR